MSSKVKLLKLPRKPKKTASNAVKERYLAKVKEIAQKNMAKIRDKAHGEHLDKKIAGLTASSVSHPSAHRTVSTRWYDSKRKHKISGTRKRKTTARRKTTRRR